MYRAIWGILPGPVWLRVIIALLLVGAVLAALVIWVFPYVDHLITPQDVTVKE